MTDDERRTIVEMMAKGTYAVILLATADHGCADVPLAPIAKRVDPDHKDVENAPAATSGCRSCRITSCT